MTRFVSGADRHQIALLPHRLDDYVSEDNPVRIVDVFVDELDLTALGFASMMPAATGRLAPDRIYTDRGMTGTNRARPGLDQALAAVRSSDTLVVPKLDRLARSVPDARTIADALVGRGIRLARGRASTIRPTRWGRCSSTSWRPSPSSRPT
ncbi:UNVERIFIED_ORG: hypothetical protein J2W74_001280 [Methylorubrum zatmanii]